MWYPVVWVRAPPPHLPDGSLTTDLGKTRETDSSMCPKYCVKSHKSRKITDYFRKIPSLRSHIGNSTVFHVFHGFPHPGKESRVPESAIISRTGCSAVRSVTPGISGKNTGCGHKTVEFLTFLIKSLSESATNDTFLHFRDHHCDRRGVSYGTEVHVGINLGAQCIPDCFVPFSPVLVHG